ncbi:MAG: radical SAM protein [Candidatus Omnitrophica bacterium]|nr:radical SAM protein [Candidatus Omnitrophota bacterium]
MARIAFLQHIWYETMGPMYLSASVKARGHECEMFIGREDRILDEITRYRPDIACFSVMTAQFPWAIALAEKIKRSNSDIVVAFGGAHPTFFPEMIEEKSVDVICVGEGELALSELADALDAGKDITAIKNLHVKPGGRVYKNEVRDFVSDIDTLPPPDRALYYKYPFLAKSPEKSFMCGRGCPYNCTFCFNHIYMRLYKDKGPFVRYRKVESVIRELIDVKSKYGLELVYFQDDTWVLNKKWLYEFLPRYKKEVRLPFIAYVRGNMVDDELAFKLKDAGCRVVDMGVETGDEARRNAILKKGITDFDLENAARLFRKHKLMFRTTNMLGLPGETIDQALRTLDVNIKLRPNFSWCSIFQPFPKLELTDMAIAEGYIPKDGSLKIGGSYKTSLLNMPDIKRIVNLQKFFIITVKYPSLSPLVKILIRFPNNALYDVIGFLCYAFMYYR